MCDCMFWRIWTRLSSSSSFLPSFSFGSASVEYCVGPASDWNLRRLIMYCVRGALFRGGKKFSTTVDTLSQREPDSMLAAMFSGRHVVCRDPDTGYVFVDRDGKHFRHILNWLRDGVIPTLSDSDYSQLLREAEYYQLLGLMDGIHSVVSKKREEDKDELDSELTRTDIIKCIQSEKVRFRGVNLAGLDLSKLDLSYVDFSYACLKNVFFSRANLHCAKFRDVDAEGSIFHNATLRECEFTGANLHGALLAGANLQSANLQGPASSQFHALPCHPLIDNTEDCTDCTG
ncbi:hypothetical protein ACJRO7_002134 [Eucalyptus globulus]|uniref:BTB domain-containing protein n=1 Tax=Eucalyptus globulus TaxID=34317 RepID=A0ABD3LU85_EUCGL